MHELILLLPDELYIQLQARAAHKGVPLEGFIVDQLTAETVNTKPQRQDQRVLEEALPQTLGPESGDRDSVAKTIAAGNC